MSICEILNQLKPSSLLTMPMNMNMQIGNMPPPKPPLTASY